MLNTNSYVAKSPPLLPSSQNPSAHGGHKPTDSLSRILTCLLLQLRLQTQSLYIFPCRCAQRISPFITPNWNKNQIKTQCLNLTFSLVYTSAHRSGTYGEKPVHRGHWSRFISGPHTSNEPLKLPIHPTPVPVSQGNSFQGSLFSDLPLLPPSARINQCPLCRAQRGLSISSAALALMCAAFLLVSTGLWSPSTWTQHLLQLFSGSSSFITRLATVSSALACQCTAIFFLPSWKAKKSLNFKLFPRTSSFLFSFKTKLPWNVVFILLSQALIYSISTCMPPAPQELPSLGSAVASTLTFS